MTVTLGPTPRYQWQGLSGDSKPTDSRVGVNDIFFETDTGNFFIFSGTAWNAYVPGGSSGTVTVTGTPVSGNLTKFSGASSITNADLTGDVTTAGGVVTTIANGAINLSGAKVTGNLPVTNLNSGSGANSGTFWRGDGTWADVATVLQVKPTARLATAAALPSNVYNNGSSGVGATLTGVSLAALSVDGQAVVIGDVILVKNEVASANNGLYTVTATGSGIAVYVLTRHPDMNVASEFSGAMIPVGSAGTANSNSLWLANPTTPVTVGTTLIPFTQLNGATDLIAGTGISISGNTISVATNGVTNALAAQMAALTIKGNNTGGTANAADLTASQVKTLLADSPDIQAFTASGTWTKPANASVVYALCVGGGGGGGSGAREPSGTVASGGAGGSAGGFSYSIIPASFLGVTVAVTVGAGGAGGVAITANGTVGNPGIDGGVSSFGTFGWAGTGNSGAGGSTGAGAGGSASAGLIAGGAGASSSGTGLVGVAASNSAGGGGGGSGGGITSGNAQSAGGAGGRASQNGRAGGTAGSAAASGNAPAVVAATNEPSCGAGGGGGGSATGATAGTGGAGGKYGGGGGGGGGSRDGQTSGAGGAGGDGLVVVYTYF